jgi:hypothetical protein
MEEAAHKSYSTANYRNRQLVKLRFGELLCTALMGRVIRAGASSS